MVRKRATAIVIGDRRVLLVRDRGSSRYSLPGGGTSRADRELYTGKGWHEQGTVYVPHDVYKYSTRSAVIRELKEETGLRATDAKFLFHHRTPFNRHSVYLVNEVNGDVKLQRSELDRFEWWDGKDHMPLRRSARAIMQRYGFPRRNLLSRVLGHLGL